MPRTTKARAREELLRAKLELVAARERGDAHALSELVARHPALSGELIEFSAALAATAGYEQVELPPETDALALRAQERAFAAVFGSTAAQAAPATAAPAFASLKALRQARKVSMPAIATRLGLGVDVVSALEAGRIRAWSIPERLLRALGEALDTTADQINGLLNTQVALSPAMRRGRGTVADGEPLDFAEAVRFSPEMSAEAKAAWLAGEK